MLHTVYAYNADNNELRVHRACRQTAKLAARAAVYLKCIRPWSTRARASDQ